MDRKRRRIINLITSIIIILVCTGIIIISFAIKSRVEQDIANSDANNSDNTSSPPSTDRPIDNNPNVNEIVEAKFIDLQPTVDKWVKTLRSPEQAGVMIYDINNSEIAAQYNPDEVFNVASIYKLLFAYDGYRQIANGSDDPNEVLITSSEKGSLTLEKCLDLIIRESYNVCADVLNKDANRLARVNGIIRDLGMTNTSNMGLNSTASDITKLLRNYWRHTDLTASLWNKITDSMLNQPPTSSNGSPVYDWRQGLPAGFSKNVKVYNKVGWEWNGSSWNTYADAAIIDFTDFNHYYTVVVITKNLSNYNKITNLGHMIEDTVTLNSAPIVK